MSVRFKTFNPVISHYTKTKQKDLLTEIALLRTTLEELWNLCKTPQELTANASVISKLTSTIRDTLVANEKLTDSYDKNMRKSEIFTIADKLMDELSKILTDSLSPKEKANVLTKMLDALSLIEDTC